MICINCFHVKTITINSRRHKKQPSVWRRRRCTACQTIFTTYEKPSLDDKPIIDRSGKTTPFNIGKLTISIAQCFQHNPQSGSLNCFRLAQTVETKLILTKRQPSIDDILTTTHHTLRQFDPVAGLQYAVRHGLVTSTRRPGRPSTTYVS